MHDLAKTATALFRVHQRSLKSRAPGSSDAVSTVVQDLFIAPLNSIIGRGTLKPAHEQQRVVGPSSLTKRFHEKRQDYFDQEVSRRHCSIEVDDEGKVRIRDLASTNGTLILKSSRAQKWITLAAGRSYRLEPGNRVRLGKKSLYEYEYLGLSVDAHIRVRLCSRDNLSLIDMNHWEWKRLLVQDRPWSTRQHCDESGQPYHGAPHFEVRLTRSPQDLLSAEVHFESSHAASNYVYQQASGHALHGAELETITITQDPTNRDLLSEEYRVVYELALPGHDSDLTAGTDFRLFLSSNKLQFRNGLDPEGWPQSSSISFGVEPDGPGVDLHFRAPKSASSPTGKDTDSTHSGRSFRHALVKSLTEQRLQDLQTKATPERMGWVGLTTIHALLDDPSLDERRFRSSVYRWKNDLQKKLAEASQEFQLSNIAAIAIADEETWDFLEESVDEDDKPQFRLRPGITCLQF